MLVQTGSCAGVIEQSRYCDWRFVMFQWFGCMCNDSSALCVMAMGIRVLYPIFEATKSEHNREPVVVATYNGRSRGVRGQGVARACSARCVTSDELEV